MIPSTSEVQHFWVFSRCLFLIAPTITSQGLIITSSGTAATSSFMYLSHTLRHHCKENSLRCSKCEGTTANNPLPTNTRLMKTFNNYVASQSLKDLFDLRHKSISSALTQHIHNIECLWFWFQLLMYRYCNNCVEGTNFLTLHMTSNYIPACRKPRANSYEWVWYGSAWSE